MKKSTRRGTLLLTAALMLGIALIAFLSILPAKINSYRTRNAACAVFDAHTIDSIALVDTYLGSHYDISAPSSTPAEYWPFVRITDKAVIADLCAQILDATREQVPYTPSIHDDKYNAYWTLILNDTQIVRLVYDNGGHGLRPSCTMIYDGTCWDMDRPATKVLYDALDALTAPPKSEEIVSASLSTLEELLPIQTVSLTGEAMDALRGAMGRFLTDAEQTQMQGWQITTVRAKATHRLDLRYADGTQLQLFYTPMVENNARIFATWQIGEASFDSATVCFQLLGEKNPFPDLFTRPDD